jgi:hypothetical protein
MLQPFGSVAASFQPKTVEGALERIKWLQHSNQAIFGGTVRTKDPSIETDNTDASVNVTKTEETTTKVNVFPFCSLTPQMLCFSPFE